MTDKIICPTCKGTGFTDGVNRGALAFEPQDKLCRRCSSSGWIPIVENEIIK